MGWVRVNTCTVLGLELDVLVGTSTSVSTGTRVLTSGASLRHTANGTAKLWNIGSLMMGFSRKADIHELTLAQEQVAHLWDPSSMTGTAKHRSISSLIDILIWQIFYQNLQTSSGNKKKKKSNNNNNNKKQWHIRDVSLTMLRNPKHQKLQWWILFSQIRTSSVVHL